MKMLIDEPIPTYMNVGWIQDAIQGGTCIRLAVGDGHQYQFTSIQLTRQSVPGSGQLCDRAVGAWDRQSLVDLHH
jgi:hypothetical protein